MPSGVKKGTKRGEYNVVRKHRRRDPSAPQPKGKARGAYNKSRVKLSEISDSEERSVVRRERKKEARRNLRKKKQSKGARQNLIQTGGGGSSSSSSTSGNQNPANPKQVSQTGGGGSSSTSGNQAPANPNQVSLSRSQNQTNSSDTSNGRFNISTKDLKAVVLRDTAAKVAGTGTRAIIVSGPRHPKRKGDRFHDGLCEDKQFVKSLFLSEDFNPLGEASLCSAVLEPYIDRGPDASITATMASEGGLQRRRFWWELKVRRGGVPATRWEEAQATVRGQMKGWKDLRGNQVGLFLTMVWTAEFSIVPRSYVVHTKFLKF